MQYQQVTNMSFSEIMDFKKSHKAGIMNKYINTSLRLKFRSVNIWLIKDYIHALEIISTINKGKQYLIRHPHISQSYLKYFGYDAKKISTNFI